MSLRRYKSLFVGFNAERFSLVTLNHMASRDISPQTNTYPSLAVGFLGAVVVILILLLLFGTCTESGRQQVENFKNKFKSSGGTDIKKLDIVMFMSPTCPYCKKMEEVLKKEGQINNITMVDITNKEGLEFAKQFGADKQPVPSFISRALKTATIGSKESVAALVADLSVKDVPSGEEQSGEAGPVENLQIILFTKEGCSWCSKAKEHCNQMGVTDKIKIIDINSPEGQGLAKELLPPGTSAVPAWVSMATKKSTVGFQPFVDILAKLK